MVTLLSARTTGFRQALPALPLNLFNNFFFGLVTEYSLGRNTKIEIRHKPNNLFSESNHDYEKIMIDNPKRCQSNKNINTRRFVMILRKKI